ncbi:unnamed protein product [Debaryomyces fabryi]|nr:unnamed protein product [Debaryomyces fabryi]
MNYYKTHRMSLVQKKIEAKLEYRGIYLAQQLSFKRNKRYYYITSSMIMEVLILLILVLYISLFKTSKK